MESKRPALDALDWVYRSCEPFIDIKKDNVLFTRARTHKFLSHLQKGELTLEQSFRPHARNLERLGHSPLPSCETENFEHIIYLGTKQREENLWNIARLIKQLSPNGSLSFALENDSGAGSYKKKLASVFDEIVSESKSKSRVYLLQKDRIKDQETLASWHDIASKSTRQNTEYHSHPAAFGWDKIDGASKLLMKEIPTDLSGQGADLGAGYGYLSRELLQGCNDIAGIDLYEAEHYALEAARKNTSSLSGKQCTYYWHDVCEGLFRKDYDWIVMNPPIHTERQHSVELFQAFLREAAKGLRKGGTLHLVCQKQLPALELLQKYFEQPRLVLSEGAHTVFQAAGRDARESATVANL